MAVLDSKIQNQIDELVNLANDYWEFNKSLYYSKIIDAWQLFPEPKNNWNEAYSLAKEIFEAFLLDNDLENAKNWLNKMVDINNNLHLFDEDCFFNYAKYQFEMGEYKDSFDKFSRVVEVAGLRYFEDEAPKYLDFYKHPEKYMR